MNKFYRFDSEAEAIRYAKALNRSSLYTSRGDPPLPRCEHPKWKGGEVPAGRKRVAAELCESRTKVHRDCPFVTWTHSGVAVDGDGKFVVIMERDDAVKGESVDVDGVPVRLNKTSETQTKAERDAHQPRWDGDRRTVTVVARGVGIPVDR